MKNPFFSVIIPTFNRRSFLGIAIESVLKQTFTDYELIVVDDGSTDKTKESIATMKDSRLRVFYQKHSGVSRARNRGIKESKADWVCFLDSDDRFVRQKLEITHDYIKKYPQYKIFHTEEIWYRNGKLLAQKAHQEKPNGFVFESSLKSCLMSPSTAAIKKDIFPEIGMFDENLPACEDYDFWLRVSAKYPVFLIPECLTIKEGGHKDQQSKKYQAMDKFRLYALEKLLKSKGLEQGHRKLAYEEFKNKCSIYIKGALKREKTEEAKHYEKLIENLRPANA